MEKRKERSKHVRKFEVLTKTCPKNKKDNYIHLLRIHAPPKRVPLVRSHTLVHTPEATKLMDIAMTPLPHPHPETSHFGALKMAPGWLEDDFPFQLR